MREIAKLGPRTGGYLAHTGDELAAYQFASVHAARGEADDAFERLARVRKSRDSGIALVRGPAVFRPLRGDARWAELVRRVGFPTG